MPNARNFYLERDNVEFVDYIPQGTWPDPQPEKATYPHPMDEILSFMDDYTPNSPGRNNWNSFEHYTQEIASPAASEVQAPSLILGVWPNTGNRYWMTHHRDVFFGWAQHLGLAMVKDPSQDYYAPSLDGQLIRVPFNLSDMKQRALKSMMPGVKADLSLINSIIELKDFKGLVKGLLQKANALKLLFQGKTSLGAVRDSWINKIKSLRLQLSLIGKGNKASLLRELDAATKSYLEWKFAIAPLISDLEAIRRNLVSHEKKINDLISREGKPRRCHFSCDTPPLRDWYAIDTFNTGIPFVYPPVYGQSQITSRIGLAYSKFHAEIEYNYNFTQYQREHARTLGLLDSLGINFNPAIVWNAVKYTFIIDWVFGVGRFLDQFRVDNMEPQINVRRFLWSWTAEVRYDWSKRLGFTDNTVPNMVYCPEVSMPSITERFYKRRTDGISASSIVSSGLSFTEFTLGAALVYARRRLRKQGK